MNMNVISSLFFQRAFILYKTAYTITHSMLKSSLVYCLSMIVSVLDYSIGGDGDGISKNNIVNERNKMETNLTTNNHTREKSVFLYQMIIFKNGNILY